MSPRARSASGNSQVTGTGEYRDAPGPSIFDFHTQEFANGVGRHVEVAVAAEGDPVEPDTALRRREGGIAVRILRTS